MAARGLLTRTLANGEIEQAPLEHSRLLTSNGLLIFAERLARMEPIPLARLQWVALFRKEPELRIPATEQDNFVAEMYRLPRAAQLALPESLRWELVAAEPVPRVVIEKPKDRYARRDRLVARVAFDYDGHLVAPADATDTFTEPEAHRACSAIGPAKPNAGRNCAELDSPVLITTSASNSICNCPPKSSPLPCCNSQPRAGASKLKELSFAGPARSTLASPAAWIGST